MKFKIKYLPFLLLLFTQSSFALNDLFIGYESDRQDVFDGGITYDSNIVSASSDPVTVSLISNPTFILNFDFTYDTNGFFSDATFGTSRTTLLNTAGNFFENIIQDSFTAITSSGINSFSAIFNNPGTGTQETISDFSVAEDTITIFVGAYDLGGSTLGQAGPGGYSISGTQTFLDNAITRGQGDGTQSSVRGTSATDFATWGGRVTFNDTSNWYYDPDVNDNNLPGIISGQSDFYSVALHELGHVLGIGTADSWDNLIIADAFTGTNVTAANGGISPSTTSTGGHFAAGTQGTVDGVAQEVAMDPNITTGTQKKFTNIDIAALDDLGFEVASPN